MKVVIPRTELYASLSKIQSVLDKKGIRPLLNYALLEAKDEILLKATNLQAYYTIKLKGSVEEEGAVALPGKKTYDIIRESKSDIITIFKDDKMISIDDKRTNYTFYSVAIDDFPKLKSPIESSKIEVNGKVIKKVIEKVSVTMGNEDREPHLAGIFIEKLQDENKLRFLSSDNHSLSLYEVELPQFYSIMEKNMLMIPRTAVNEIEKMDSEDASWKLTLEPEGMYIESGSGVTLYVVLKDQEFIDYSPLSNVKIEHRAIIKKGPLQEALKRMAAFLEGYLKQIEMEFLESGRLAVTAITNEGKAEETLEVNYEGKWLRVLMNPKELLAVIQVMDSDEVDISFTRKGRACIITGKGDQDFLCVLMPFVEETESEL